MSEDGAEVGRGDHRDHIYVVRRGGTWCWTTEYELAYQEATGIRLDDYEGDDPHPEEERISIMHTRGREYVLDLSHEHPYETCLNRQYDCAHVAFGPPKRLPSECPECHPVATDGGHVPRQKTEFWGYDQHERSARDVTDDERWQTELEWALDESLAYARMVESPETAISANHCVQRNFMGHFEAMLNDLLHKPLDLCTATETVQETEQATLGGGTVAE